MAALASPALSVPSAIYRYAATPSLNDTLAQLGLTVAAPTSPPEQRLAAPRVPFLYPVIMDYIAPDDCPDCPIIKIQSMSVSSMLDDSLKTAMEGTQVTFVPFSDGPSVSKFLLSLAQMPKSHGEVCHLGDVAPAPAFTIPFCNADGSEQYFVCLHRSLLMDEYKLMAAINCQFERITLWRDGKSFDSPEAGMGAAASLSERSLARIEKNIETALPREPDLELLLKILRSHPHQSLSPKAEEPSRKP